MNEVKGSFLSVETMRLLPHFALFALMLLPLETSAEEGVSPSPYILFKLMDFPITNSMVTAWVLSLLLVLLVRYLMGRYPQRLPSKGQLVLEQLLLRLRGLIEPVVGAKCTPKVFPLLLGFFLFILMMNWSGLLPGVGAFGHEELLREIAPEQVEAAQEAGVRITERNGQYYESHLKYYFRPSNSDLNTTLALSIISFVAWLFFVFKYVGLRALARDLFGNKADKSTTPLLIYLPLFLVFIGVGFIEIISILSRLISLSFRLYGNVFGGESLLASIQSLMPYVVPVPFYFLELLIGLVQALVFTLLTAVYIGLLTNHGGEEAQR